MEVTATNKHLPHNSPTALHLRRVKVSIISNPVSNRLRASMARNRRNLRLMGNTEPRPRKLLTVLRPHNLRMAAPLRLRNRTVLLRPASTISLLPSKVPTARHPLNKLSKVHTALLPHSKAHMAHHLPSRAHTVRRPLNLMANNRRMVLLLLLKDTGNPLLDSNPMASSLLLDNTELPPRMHSSILQHPQR